MPRRAAAASWMWGWGGNEELGAAALKAMGQQRALSRRREDKGAGTAGPRVRGRRDEGRGWEMRTKGTQSCSGAQPEHEGTNCKTFWFFFSQIYSLPSPSQAKQPRDGNQEILYRKSTDLAGERKGSEPRLG